jgi:hypothetical protein
MGNQSAECGKWEILTCDSPFGAVSELDRPSWLVTVDNSAMEELVAGSELLCVWIERGELKFTVSSTSVTHPSLLPNPSAELSNVLHLPDTDRVPILAILAIVSAVNARLTPHAIEVECVPPSQISVE